MSERMKSYQLESLFKEAAKLCASMPYFISEQLKQTTEDGIDETLGNIATAMEQVKGFEELMERKADEVMEICDKHYAKIKTKHAIIRKKIEELPDLKLSQGYIDARTFKDLCDAADRFSYLDDTKWGRVVELAKAISAGKADNA